MTPAAWRDFAHRPGGVLLLLLLVALLALGGRFCPMPAHAASLPAPVGHDGCPDAPPPDSPAKNFPQFCDGGACLHSVDHHDAADQLAASAGGWDQSPPPLAVAGSLPSDWTNGARPLLAPVVSATSPPPLQRSRVLRL